LKSDKVSYLNRLTGVFILFILCMNTGFAQFDAYDVFDSKCVLCHTIGMGDLKGPDLIGVTERRQQDWLIRFIQSSQSMIEAGDPVAVELFAKYNQTEMQDWDYSEGEIIELLNYISTFSGSAVTDNEIVTDSASKDSKQILLDELNAIIEYYKDKKRKNISILDIETGEALFTGQLSFNNGAEVCVNCHNVIEIDTLNLNPSAFEIAQKYPDRIIDVSKKPPSKIMRGVYKDHELDDLEIKYISYYLESISENGLTVKKKINFNKIIAFSLLFLLIFSIVDLKFRKVIKLKQIHYAIILLVFVYFSNEVYLSAKNLSLSENYEPVQPIKFSHKIHAGSNRINCIYCHSSVTESKIAGIPPANVCMNCHKAVKSGTISGKYEINKIYESINTNTPIEWIQVHNLPDHVFFSHAQHVKAGKRECADCHGKVEEMERVRQVADLSMGWCLDCHRTSMVNSDSNDYYISLYKHSDLQNRKLNVEDIGGNDCQRCHY